MAAATTVCDVRPWTRLWSADQVCPVLRGVALQADAERSEGASQEMRRSSCPGLRRVRGATMSEASDTPPCLICGAELDHMARTPLMPERFGITFTQMLFESGDSTNSMIISICGSCLVKGSHQGRITVMKWFSPPEPELSLWRSPGSVTPIRRSR